MPVTALHLPHTSLSALAFVNYMPLYKSSYYFNTHFTRGKNYDYWRISNI